MSARCLLLFALLPRRDRSGRGPAGRARRKWTSPRRWVTPCGATAPGAMLPVSGAIDRLHARALVLEASTRADRAGESRPGAGADACLFRGDSHPGPQVGRRRYGVPRRLAHASWAGAGGGYLAQREGLLRALAGAEAGGRHRCRRPVAGAGPAERRGQGDEAQPQSPLKAAGCPGRSAAARAARGNPARQADRSRGQLRCPSDDAVAEADEVIGRLSRGASPSWWRRRRRRPACSSRGRRAISRPTLRWERRARRSSGDCWARKCWR